MTRAMEQQIVIKDENGMDSKSALGLGWRDTGKLISMEQIFCQDLIYNVQEAD